MAVLEKNFLISLAEDAVKSALKLGASEAEAYVYDGQATNIGIDLGQISKTHRIIDRGLGIRVIVNKTVGFAYTNIISNPQTVESVATRALSAAKASRPDPDWHGLPPKKPYRATEDTFDSAIVDLHPEDLVKAATNMLDAAGEENPSVFPIEGGVGSGYVANAIANSNGIAAFDRGTIAECSLAALAKNSTSVTPVCFEFDASRKYLLNPIWVGSEAAKLAISALEPKPVETQTAKVILTQFALQDLFAYTLMTAVKADSVQRNQSPFKDKLGTQIASENLSIYDDGLYPGGLRTAVFDAEGTPQQKTILIKNGVLQNFLYDTYSARKDGKESTGNAVRAEYLSTPSIAPSNFHILPGSKTPSQLLTEAEDSFIIYYLQGAHSSNPVSGEFSVVANPCWKIKNGEITHPCRGVMLAGNIFDLLKNIIAVGVNERQMGSIIAPWVLVEGMKIIGK
ncbi:MAG: TldD/PmbA family protein [Nitrososphaerota archaeon]|nr:TldD/PmbA family protein [Nitrososphaerota archaeon]